MIIVAFGIYKMTNEQRNDLFDKDYSCVKEFLCDEITEAVKKLKPAL